MARRRLYLRTTTPEFSLSIFEEDFFRISKLVSVIPYAETGGNLFGLWTNQGNAVVLVATGPGQDCRRTAVSFYQDIPYMKRVGDLLTGPYPLCHIGEWHSHHQMQLFEPSAGDCNTIQRNYPTGSQGFVLMIANILRDGTVTLSPYKFKDKYSPYEKGSMEIVNEGNPFMMVERIIKAIKNGKEKMSYQKLSGIMKDRGIQGTGDSCLPLIETNDLKKRSRRDCSSSPTGRDNRSRSRSPIKGGDHLLQPEAQTNSHERNPPRQENIHLLTPHPPTEPKKGTSTPHQRKVCKTSNTQASIQTPLISTEEKTLGTISTKPSNRSLDRPRQSSPARSQEHTIQWYETQPDTVKIIVEFLASLADDKETVNISRDKSTLNLTTAFTHHNHIWSVLLPHDFPRGTVKLKNQRGLENAHSWSVKGRDDINRFMTELRSMLKEQCRTCKNSRTGYHYCKNLSSSHDPSPSRLERSQDQTPQWYDSQPDTLRRTMDFVASLADDKKTVNISRDTSTMNITMGFTHHGHTWTVDFPSNFPCGSVQLRTEHGNVDEPYTSSFSYSHTKPYFSCSLPADGDITNFLYKLESKLHTNCKKCTRCAQNNRYARSTIFT